MDAPQARQAAGAAPLPGQAAATQQTRPSWRARLETALWRHGWAWPVGALLLTAAALLEATQVRPLQAQLAEARAAEQRAGLQAAALKAAPPASAQRDATRQAQAAISQTLSALAASRDVNGDVAQLLVLARRHGIELSQAQYQSSVDAQAGMQRLQITLPARAGYGQARAWMQDLLLAMPLASVDQFELKRPGRGDAELAMSVKLSLWRLAPPKAGAKP